MSLVDFVNEMNSIVLEPDPEDINMLKAIKPKIAEWKTQLRKAQRAGIDTAEDITDLDNLESEIDKLIAVYG